MPKQDNNSEQPLTKKVWTLTDIIAVTSVGFTDYITQLAYLLFLNMDDEKVKLGLSSAIPAGYGGKDYVDFQCYY
jgi:type I restriction enzyme M protein